MLLAHCWQTQGANQEPAKWLLRRSWPLISGTTHLRAHKRWQDNDAGKHQSLYTVLGLTPQTTQVEISGAYTGPSLAAASVTRGGPRSKGCLGLHC